MRCTHAPTVGNQTIPGLSFADNLAVGPFRVNGLQRGIDHMAKYCNRWNWMFNFDKNNSMVFKNGRMMKNRQYYYLNWQYFDVANETTHLRLKRTGKWKTHRENAKAIGIKIL